MSTERRLPAFRAWPALLAAGLAACSAERPLPAPHPQAMEPAVALAGDTLDVVIRGADFYLQGRRRVGEGITEVLSTFEARVGGVALEDVQRTDEGALRARLPGRLPVGRWDLVVRGPAGEGVLAAAFEVRATAERCTDGVDNDADGALDCADGADCLAAACDDGQVCTQGDACRDDATCAGIALAACVPPTTCSAGEETGQPCDDGNPCTREDVCAPGGACAGTAYGCGPAGECVAAQCLGDGRCSTHIHTGSPCAGGVCRADGTCGPVDPRFGYVPSNFNAEGLAPQADANITCEAAFDSSLKAFLGPWCTGEPQVHDVRLADGSEAVLLAWRSFHLQRSGRLSFYGARPVIIAALEDVHLEGELRLDAGWSLPGLVHAGANGPACAFQPAGVGAGAAGGAGGGGAGHATAGAAGGAALVAPGGRAGGALPAPGHAPLRGGCRGGAGGGTSGGSGGNGGGALQVSAGGKLHVTGTLSASGAGGEGARAARSGGGGGGSGGSLLLEGTDVTFDASARLTANGGAGGGGAGQDGGGAGMDGAVAAGTAATGGTPGSSAGAGGAGAALDSPPQVGQGSAVAGAGGGGGAAGRIFLRVPGGQPGPCEAPCLISPAPVLLQGP